MPEETITRARKLRKVDDLEESQEILLDLLAEHPNHPVVLYEIGGSYDVMGEEKQAIPFYKKAIEAGLDGDDLQECLVCLGSSQRNVGDFEEAIQILEKTVDQFPNNNSGKTFLALAYYSEGREDEAVRLLLELLLETSNDENILAYADALGYYKDNLDEVWDD